MKNLFYLFMTLLPDFSLEKTGNRKLGYCIELKGNVILY